jgi:hypothetical protein
VVSGVLPQIGLHGYQSGSHGVHQPLPARRAHLD